MKIAIVALVLVGLGLLSGCVHMFSEQYGCQMRAVNLSDNPIRFVVMDVDVTHTSFGFLNSGGTAGATRADGTVRFTEEFVIGWKELGQVLRASVDMSVYSSKRRYIRSMEFSYVGDGKWTVMARDGYRRDSKVVDPE